ncbi:J domain-containing protein [Vibrio mediterranei]|uniref:J domain-containing protein n=1 Tax=Vibrio mediterranei TaxID=689 RepID=UPI004068DE3A
MKMTQIKAVEVLNVTFPLGKSALKTAYKKAMLKTHPDRVGDGNAEDAKRDTQEINSAYKLLKPMAIDDNDIGKETFYVDEEITSHPLHNSNLSSVNSFETMLKDTFHMMDEPYTTAHMHKHYCWKPRSGTYFQESGKTYRAHTISNGYNETVQISDETDAGKTGKVCPTITLWVSQFSAKYGERSQLISNVFRDWFEEGLSFGSIYETLIEAIREAEINQDFEVLKASAVVTDRCEYRPHSGYITIDGSTLCFSVEETKGIRSVNPYTLTERYKPVTSVPKRLSVAFLAKILINGQFHSLFANNICRDDSRYDSEGYVDNPIALAVDWIISGKGNCGTLWENNGNLSFGFHSNNSNNCVIDFSNRHPEVDLADAVETLCQQTLALDKAS